MRRLAWALVALTRATKEYEESFAEDLFGNLELYEQASLNGDLTNAEARRARLVEDLDARWAATEGNTANDVVPGLWDERVEEGWFDGPPAVAGRAESCGVGGKLSDDSASGGSWTATSPSMRSALDTSASCGTVGSGSSN